MKKKYKEIVPGGTTDSLIESYRILMDAMLIPNDGSRKYKNTLKKVLLLANLIEEELHKRGINSI